MKTKLLKQLRKKFYVEYFPGKKLYKVNGTQETYHKRESDAITHKECDMINYARKYYEKYAKRIRLF